MWLQDNSEGVIPNWDDSCYIEIGNKTKEVQELQDWNLLMWLFQCHLLPGLQLLQVPKAPFLIYSNLALSNHPNNKNNSKLNLILSINLLALIYLGLMSYSAAKITPFNTFLSTMATLRPLAHNAVAMKIPRVPPHTTTSYDPSALLARSDERNKLGMEETTCWGSCTTAIYIKDKKTKNQKNK